MTDLPASLIEDAAPNVGAEELAVWPRCAHCRILIDGPRLRAATSLPSPYATSWHADKPECRTAAEESVRPAPQECPEHPGIRLVDGECEMCAWHDGHADVFTASAQFEIDQADEARCDADELG